MSGGGPECIKCGGTLEQPSPAAQFECPDCGAVVAAGSIKHDSGSGW